MGREGHMDIQAFGVKQIYKRNQANKVVLDGAGNPWILADVAIRDGRIAYCHHCGDHDWAEMVEVYDDSAPVPLCRDCKKEHEARY